MPRHVSFVFQEKAAPINRAIRAEPVTSTSNQFPVSIRSALKRYFASSRDLWLFSYLFHSIAPKHSQERARVITFSLISGKERKQEDLIKA
ncbi:hypothetical protein NPIL_378201 [Nephila pilipes]|uniref:Uncharacterized protein n=1 Tax=Nephila pilipes TaxID=299642 RepID=A0A8X6IYL9_NEPPI|nr:hypothetical protein NPIL_378201 [Nephila pilipes]